LVCLHLLRRQGTKALPVFINYGQRNREREFRALERNLKAEKFSRPQIIDISGFGKVIRSGLTDPRKRVFEDAFTPNRNLLFLTLAASVAFSRGISFVILGFLSEKTAIFPDQSDSFLSATKHALSESLGVNIEIVCPLRDMRKQDVVRLSKTLRVRTSYSCHAGGEKPCGKCIACLEYGEGGSNGRL
jgi:7-cyano-7-deazaguanine synthase